MVRGEIQPDVGGRYLSLFFQGVVSTLQLLHLLLGCVMLCHVGAFCGNGLQRTAMAQNLLIEKLKYK